MKSKTGSGRRVVQHGQVFGEVVGKTWKSKYGPQSNVAIVLADGRRIEGFHFVRDAFEHLKLLSQGA